MQDLTAPCLLTDGHILEYFDCGEDSLNDWLKKKALKNQFKGTSRCFVLCEQEKAIGYYSLSAGAIGRENLPKSLQRNMPTSIPVILLGRLGIDLKYHNHGLGSALLRDAMLRILHISTEVGVYLILIHAISEPAKQFYLSRGFTPSFHQDMTLMMTIETLREIMNE